MRTAPVRRVARAAVVAGVVALALALAVLVPQGGSVRVSQRYGTTRVLRAGVLERCVTVSVRGTVVGTRSDRFGAVRWTDVRVLDPTIVAEGSMLDHGRCDRARPWRMRADLVQSWTASGTAVDTRRSDEGPATGPLSQFNSGAPIVVPDVLRLRVPGTAPALAMRADVSVVARTPETDETLRLPVEVVLH